MTITTYHNFDLLIARTGGCYQAFVVDAPAGEAKVRTLLAARPSGMARQASACASLSDFLNSSCSPPNHRRHP